MFKKPLLLIIALTFVQVAVFAQQWTGTNNTTATISRSGVVQVGAAEGNMRFNVTDNNVNGGGIFIQNKNVSPAAQWLLLVQGTGQYLPGGFSLYDQTNGRGHRFMIDGNGHTFLSPYAGNVAIGMLNPGNYKLNVNGRVRANEIVVNTTGADFVFADKYRLRPLSEVETYIKANKHLPDIASAADMQKEGLALGEFQSKLLQKIEELTLYMIELKKENEELRKEVEKLKN